MKEELPEVTQNKEKETPVKGNVDKIVQFFENRPLEGGKRTSLELQGPLKSEDLIEKSLTLNESNDKEEKSTDKEKQIKDTLEFAEKVSRIRKFQVPRIEKRGKKEKNKTEQFEEDPHTEDEVKKKKSKRKISFSQNQDGVKKQKSKGSFFNFKDKFKLLKSMFGKGKKQHNNEETEPTNVRELGYLSDAVLNGSVSEIGDIIKEFKERREEFKDSMVQHPEDILTSLIEAIRLLVLCITFQTNSYFKNFSEHSTTMKAYQVDMGLYLNLLLSEFINKLKEGILDNTIMGEKAIKEFISKLLSKIDKNDFNVIKEETNFQVLLKSFIEETLKSSKITVGECDALCAWLNDQFEELSGSLVNSYN